MKMYFLSFVSLLLCSLLIGKVEVIEISPRNTSDLPGGKEADGIIGDFVLKKFEYRSYYRKWGPEPKSKHGCILGTQWSDARLPI